MAWGALPSIPTPFSNTQFFVRVTLLTLRTLFQDKAVLFWLG